MLLTVRLLVFLSLVNFAIPKTLPVSVYYESLCPDSIRFITKQLYPSFKYVNKYIQLDLVPFGKATENNSSGHWEFTCQHGPPECYNNKVHSCVLELNSIASSVEFINCAMSRESLVKCANSSNISWDSIDKCLSSGEADELLARNGMKTESVVPPITYIPTIIFNGIYNKDTQKEAENHFLNAVCKMLKQKPDFCQKFNIDHNIISDMK